MKVPILQITRTIDPADGGVGRVAFALAREFRRRGIPVVNRTLYPLDLPPGTDLGQIDASPRLARLLRMLPGKYLQLLVSIPVFSLLATITALREKNSVVLVHAASFTGDIFRTPSCHRAALGVKWKKGERRWIFYPLHFFLVGWEYFVHRVGKPPRLVCISNAVAAEFKHYYGTSGKNISFIPNGVDPDIFRPPPDRKSLRKRLGLPAESFLAIFVGNDFKNKGLRQAIEGLARSDHTRDPRLLVIGEGNREKYERIANSLGVAGRVSFLGKRSDVEHYFAAADLFLLLSSYEAFGIVIVEALSCGLPVVATRVGGIVDLVQHEKNGLLVDREREAIAKALNRMMGEPDLYRRLAAAARPSIEGYHWSRIADQYIELCEKIARGKGK